MVHLVDGWGYAESQALDIPALLTLSGLHPCMGSRACQACGWSANANTLAQVPTTNLHQHWNTWPSPIRTGGRFVGRMDWVAELFDDGMYCRPPALR